MDTIAIALPSVILTYQSIKPDLHGSLNDTCTFRQTALYTSLPVTITYTLFYFTFTIHLFPVTLTHISHQSHSPYTLHSYSYLTHFLSHIYTLNLYTTFLVRLCYTFQSAFTHFSHLDLPFFFQLHLFRYDSQSHLLCNFVLCQTYLHIFAAMSHTIYPVQLLHSLFLITLTWTLFLDLVNLFYTTLGPTYLTHYSHSVQLYITMHLPQTLHIVFRHAYWLLCHQPHLLSTKFSFMLTTFLANMSYFTNYLQSRIQNLDTQVHLLYNFFTVTLATHHIHCPTYQVTTVFGHFT